MKEKGRIDTAIPDFDYAMGEGHTFATNPEHTVGTVMMDPTPSPDGLEETTRKFLKTKEGRSILKHAQETGRDLFARTTAHGEILIVAGAVVAAGLAALGGREVYRHLHSRQHEE